MKQKSHLVSLLTLTHLLLVLPISAHWWSLSSDEERSPPSHAFSFNLHEFENANYHVDILSEPVSESASLRANILEFEKDGAIVFPVKEAHILVSSTGQKFQCSFPSLEGIEREAFLAKANEIEDKYPPPESLLEDVGCLEKTYDWWSYRFCHRGEIFQYHIEKGLTSDFQISTGNFQSLGRFNEEETMRANYFKDRRDKSHIHIFQNGSVCDLTGQQRHTVVRFVCEEQLEMMIEMLAFVERKTCVYEIVIGSLNLCKNHDFLYEIEKDPQIYPVNCGPILLDQDFKNYQKYLFFNHYKDNQHDAPPSPSSLFESVENSITKNDIVSFLKKFISENSQNSQNSNAFFLEEILEINQEKNP
eukprot:Sdes_comp13220_c0_seq1m3104